MRREVFISYSSADRLVADAICSALEGHNINCWIAPRNVVPGASYGEALVDAIHQAEMVVLVLSSQSNYSSQVAREIERAAARAKPILPFRIENVNPSKQLEFFISASHWLDALTVPLDDHLETLISAVRIILENSKERSASDNSKTYTVAAPERGVVESHDRRQSWRDVSPTPESECTPCLDRSSSKLIMRVEANDPVSVGSGESQSEHPSDTPAYGNYVITERKRAYTIGRNDDNEIVLDDTIASRHHAFIYFSEGRFTIVDGSIESDGTIKRSTNGIIVDGQPQLQAVLLPGSVIIIGKHKITCF